MFRLHSNQDGGSIALKLSARLRRAGIEFRSHENGAGLGVDQQVIAGLTIHRETIAGSPVEHLLPAAANNGDVEGLNLHLLKHGCFI